MEIKWRILNHMIYNDRSLNITFIQELKCEAYEKGREWEEWEREMEKGVLLFD